MKPDSSGLKVDVMKIVNVAHCVQGSVRASVILSLPGLCLPSLTSSQSA